jgi:hypothetical protein
MTQNQRSESLQAAYQMAGRIHGSKLIAYCIAVEAMERWPRIARGGQLSDRQLFQRLVCELSAYFERAAEALNSGNQTAIEAALERLAKEMTHHHQSTESGEAISHLARRYLSRLKPIAQNLNEETMMRHYIKTLALIALKRSPVKGLCAFLSHLFRLETKDIQTLHDWLEPSLPKQGGAKDSQFFNHRRSEVLDEIVDRFGDVLSTETRPTHNQEKSRQIVARKASKEEAERIREILDELAPCDVECPGKARENGNPFSNKGEFIHQLMHWACLDFWLTAWQPASHPELFLPIFNVKGSRGSDSSQRMPNKPLSPLSGWAVRVAL